MSGKSAWPYVALICGDIISISIFGLWNAQLGNITIGLLFWTGIVAVAFAGLILFVVALLGAVVNRE